MSLHINVELHTHSTASDGQYSPGELYSKCKALDIKVWSLTDHDTMRGCQDVLSLPREDSGMTFIPGVEISARDKVSVHVLGYGLDPEDQALQELFEGRRQERLERMMGMVEKARMMGFELTLEELHAEAPDGNFARPHLAKVLLKRGYVKSMQHAFDKYLGDGKPLYIKSPYMSVEDAIALIRANRGVAVIAHPGTSRRDECIPQWVDSGLDGLECKHPAHSAELAAHYQGLARRHGLLHTASSDFHGPDVAPERRLGHATLPQDALEQVLAKIKQRGGIVVDSL